MIFGALLGNFRSFEFGCDFCEIFLGPNYLVGTNQIDLNLEQLQ
jgi:hypothetical protein